jgi:hypothetical protein
MSENNENEEINENIDIEDILRKRLFPKPILNDDDDDDDYYIKCIKSVEDKIL